MSKTVKIDYELYKAIYDYFLGSGADEGYIKTALQIKQEKLNNHALYSISKNERLSEEVREIARKTYLDNKGISEDFRY